MPQIQQLVKQLREVNNISTSQMADKIGVVQKHYAQWESGNLEITFDQLLAVSRVFNMSLVELLTYGGNDYYGKAKR